MKTHADYYGTPNVSVVMDLLAQLAIKDGATPASKHPEGWIRQIDERWTVCLNGGDRAVAWEGFTIPRFHCAITYNGWPAGLISPFEGTIAAGEAANEDALIDAIRRALTR